MQHERLGRGIYDRVPPRIIFINPSARFKDFGHVELYLAQEGCVDAQGNQRTHS